MRLYDGGTKAQQHKLHQSNPEINQVRVFLIVIYRLFIKKTYFPP